MKNKRKYSIDGSSLDCDATEEVESRMDEGISDKSEEEDMDETAHANLIKDITKIREKKRLNVTRAVRTSSGAVRSIDKQDVLKRLGDSVLQKQSKKLKTLPKPLEKPVEIRAKKAAGYEKVVEEVNQWEKLVNVRRREDQLTFPLEQPDVRIKTIEAAKELPMKTSLEKEVYSLLRGAKLEKPKEEKPFKRYMSLAAIQEKNREMWIMKELQRKAERKAWMQNKSKSRKYHRILRKERKKKEKAELEKLKQTDPEAAMEILNELEKSRIAERMTLRHRQSKWSKTQVQRAKHDKTSLAAVQENELVHKELVKKINPNAINEDGKDNEDIKAVLEEREEAAAKGTYDPMNPWLTAGKKRKGPVMGEEGEDEEEDESFTKFKKFWSEVNKRKVFEKKFLEDQTAKEEEQKKEKEALVDKGGVLEEINKLLEGEDSDDESDSDDDEEEGEEEEEEEEEGEEEEEEVEKEGEEEEMEDKDEQVSCQVQEEESEEIEETDSRPTSEAKIEKVEGIEETDKNEEAVANKSAESEDKDKTSQEIDIDEIFDETEYQIQQKMDKKTNKMNKKKKKRKNKIPVEPTEGKPVIMEYDFTSHNTTENTTETLQRISTMEEVEKFAEKWTEGRVPNSPTILLKDKGKEEVEKEEKVEIDPTKFMQVKTKTLNSGKPERMADGEALDDDDDGEEDDKDDDPQDIIREAFADDYLISDFKSEKEEAVKKGTPGDLCMAMPGWGDWTGPNIEMSKTKIKRFTVKVPKPKRKDSKLGHVIYNEKADLHNNLRKLMVSDLPRDFSSVKDFEASVRAPIGRNFVPELVHRKLTKQPVITKMGSIIEPMEKEVLMQAQKKNLAVIGKMGKSQHGNQGGQKKAKQQRNNRGSQKNKGKLQQKNNQGIQKNKGPGQRTGKIKQKLKQKTKVDGT